MVVLDRIKELSKKKGWSLSFLASKLGLTASYFTDVKNGKTKISNDRLITIADILSTTPEYLKGETDVKEKTPAEPGERTVSDEDIMFALFNGADDITDEMFEEVKRFAQFIQERERNKPD